jgi:hypothetical protein
MASETQAHSNGDLSRGLPPVTPPSGKFIVKLFLVPGLIVAVIVVVFVLFFAGQNRQFRPEIMLNDLRSANPDVRWRAAERLAQILPRDCREPSPRYALDCKFALDLAEEMRKAMQVEEEMLGRIGHKSREEAPKEYKDLEVQQDLIRFLGGSLGCFDVPVTAPFLSEIASQQATPGNRAQMERGRLAIVALANLGNNLQYYFKLPEDRKAQVLEQLENLAETAGDKGRWAKATLDYLKYQDPLGVEKSLIQCAKADDAYTRKLAALAMSFWDGSETDATLEALVYDDGHGSDAEQQASYQREIGYQAVIALARRGSKRFADHPEWLATLADMLDEEHQMSLNRSIVRDKEVVDESKATETVNTALRAVAELHRLQPELDLSQLKPTLEKLTSNRSNTIKDEAKALLGSLNKTA